MNSRSGTYLLATLGALLLLTVGALVAAAGSDAAPPGNAPAGWSAVPAAPAVAADNNGQDPQGPLSLIKTVSEEFAMLDDTIGYTLTLANSGAVIAGDLRVEDPIPDGTAYVPDSAAANHGTVAYSEGKIVWTGVVPPNQAAVIRFRVKIRTYQGCTTVVTNRAALFHAGSVLLSNPTYTRLLCPDLGDAPDSTNHYTNAMTAYPATGVLARYPTVFDPATGALQGPSHWLPRADVWLGRWVSGERDADLLPDEDGTPNLRPPADVADRDRFDDGLQLPVSLRHCQVNTLNYRVTARPGLTRDRYVNVWFDYNRDGDWDDSFDCGHGVPLGRDGRLSLARPARRTARLAHPQSSRCRANLARRNPDLQPDYTQYE